MFAAALRFRTTDFAISFAMSVSGVKPHMSAWEAVCLSSVRPAVDYVPLKVLELSPENCPRLWAHWGYTPTKFKDFCVSEFTTFCLSLGGATAHTHSV